MVSTSNSSTSLGALSLCCDHLSDLADAMLTFFKLDEWVQVSAHPEILDLILRLHIRIGLCHQRLGDEYESVMTFEDAYKVNRTFVGVRLCLQGF